MTTIKNVLGQSAYWQVNKHLAHRVGIEAALLLSDMVDRWTYFVEQGQTVEIDGKPHFFATSDEIRAKTTLTYRKQKSALKSLESEKLLEARLAGTPAKLHFHVCEEAIWQTLQNKFSRNAKTGVNKSAKQDSTKAQDISNKETVSKNKNKGAPPQTDLFDKVVKGAHLFKNDVIYDLDLYKRKFSEAAAMGIDVEYYYHRAKNWSASKAAKRHDWAAVIRNMMLDDKAKNKLQMSGQGNEQNIGAIADFLTI